MKLLRLAISIAGLAILAFACPFSISCPADRTEMHKVGDEYEGLLHLAIYEHQTTAGVTHRVTIRCDRETHPRSGAFRSCPCETPKVFRSAQD